jgi:hypothetical protein
MGRQEVAVRPGDLLDQAVGPEQAQQARDPRGLVSVAKIIDGKSVIPDQLR